MSASEKLKGLGHDRTPEWEGRWLDFEGTWVNVDDLLAFRDALPQIVAVCEEAQAVADEFVAKALLEALDELEKALS